MTTENEYSLACLIQTRAKNLEEHAYLISQVKVHVRDFADTFRRLESDPEHVCNADVLKAQISEMNQKQRQARAIRIELSKLETTLLSKGIPLSGI